MLILKLNHVRLAQVLHRGAMVARGNGGDAMGADQSIVDGPSALPPIDRSGGYCHRPFFPALSKIYRVPHMIS